jgi:hypothetical protein
VLTERQGEAIEFSKSFFPLLSKQVRNEHGIGMNSVCLFFAINTVVSLEDYESFVGQSGDGRSREKVLIRVEHANI